MTILNKLTFVVCLFPVLLNAQNGANRVFTFLEQPNSARLLSLGGNMASIHDGDVGLLLSNPSYISDSVHRGLSVHYTDYFAGINYGTATYSHSLKKAGSFAASVQYMNYGRFDETDVYGQVIGSFTASDWAFTVGWGRVLAPGFSIGANAKVIYSDMYLKKSSGLAVDVAGSYFNDDKYFSATLLIRNAGRQLNTYTTGISEPLPFDIQLGVSKRLMHVPLRFSFLAHHLYKWDIRYSNPSDVETDPLTGLPVTERKLSAFSDKLMRHLVIGAELAPSKSFSLRIGYNYQRRKELTVASRLSTVGLSWGFGIRIKKLYLSYARSAYHLAGSPNVITLTTNLSDYIK